MHSNGTGSTLDIQVTSVKSRVGYVAHALSTAILEEMFRDLEGHDKCMALNCLLSPPQ